MRLVSLAAGCAVILYAGGALFAGSALAQGGPMSVGLSSDPTDLALHCAAAVLAENYLVNEEGKTPVFDQAKLDAAMEAWTKDIARRKGVDVDTMTGDKVLLALAEDKAWKDDIRIPQARWCMARMPG